MSEFGPKPQDERAIEKPAIEGPHPEEDIPHIKRQTDPAEKIEGPSVYIGDARNSKGEEPIFDESYNDTPLEDLLPRLFKAGKHELKGVGFITAFNKESKKIAEAGLGYSLVIKCATPVEREKIYQEAKKYLPGDWILISGSGKDQLEIAAMREGENTLTNRFVNDSELKLFVRGRFHRDV